MKYFCSFLLLILMTSLTGCGSDPTDEFFSLFNIHIERDFEYYDDKNEQTVSAHLEIVGKDVEIYDELGNMGVGTLEDGLVTGEFWGPIGTGTITINFDSMFEHYDGVIELDDGRLITFSE